MRQAAISSFAQLLSTFRDRESATQFIPLSSLLVSLGSSPSVFRSSWTVLDTVPVEPSLFCPSTAAFTVRGLVYSTNGTKHTYKHIQNTLTELIHTTIMDQLTHEAYYVTHNKARVNNVTSLVTRADSCCWRESVKPLQYYCQSLPLSYIVSEHRLLFWRKMLISDNIVLAVLSRGIVSKFVAVGSQYGISTWTLSAAKIKLLIKLCYR